jgi:molybdenum cofactor biosynthesis enzyme MoaA
MPEEGVPLTPTTKLLSSAEIVRVAKTFVHQGVDKIRITGGEPLLRADLPSIISKPLLGMRSSQIDKLSTQLSPIYMLVYITRCDTVYMGRTETLDKILLNELHKCLI